MVIDCPGCGGECRRVSEAPNVAHWYCPDCQPGYDPTPPSGAKRVLWILGIVALLPVAVLAKIVYSVKP